MRKSLLMILTVLFLGSGSLFAEAVEPVPRPKLVVGIVVDQMRWDYLYRYYDRYEEDGFKRMLKEGFSFENTYINHVPTVTAIGHATVFTGTIPAVHGITGNSIMKNTTGESENCVWDADVEGVGTTTKLGKASPKNLLANTIGDELRLATNFRSKVIGVSFKDRAAILPAGHAANAAFWFDSKAGTWITSTYYMNDLPRWVKDFNQSNRIANYLDQDWNTLYPIETYIQSTEDDKPYEGTLSGQEKAVFPVKTSELYSKDDYSVIYTIPYGNSLTLDFAKETVRNEKMGQGNETDMLTINLASTDAAGHRFGINSIEVEDTYLRLDQDLAAFFKYLDETVGKGEYTVFLTADHGGQHNPQFLEENKLPLNPTVSGKELTNELNAAIEKEFGVKGVVKTVSGLQVRFDYPVIKEHVMDEQAIRDLCVAILRKNPSINFVVDMNKPYDAAVPENLREMIIHGHYPDRSGAIQIIMGANAFNPKAKGTSHGNWNPYDSKIPFLLMGWGVKQGEKSYEVAHMQDIAPTVANILKIQPPNGTVGKAKEAAIDKEQL